MALSEKSYPRVLSRQETPNVAGVGLVTTNKKARKNNGVNVLGEHRGGSAGAVS